MKYITTDTHPELKEGIEFEKSIDYNDFYQSELGWTFILDDHFNECIENGYIKELQEPEFTKDDMMQFCGYLHNKLPTHSKTPKELLNDWLKQRSK